MSRHTKDLPPHGAPGDLTARFYDAVAADYDSLVDGRIDNVEMRLSFCERVVSVAGPGGVILDFGCGTGTDAAWYAARGHRVMAYDVSPGMVEVFRERCKNEIESGRITLTVGPIGGAAQPPSVARIASTAELVLNRDMALSHLRMARALA